jgi:predicted nucleotidyltransferase
MKITEETLSTAAQIARRYGAKRLLVFGSAIKPGHEARDIDFACEGVSGWTLFKFGAALEEALKMPVDLVSLDERTDLGRMVESQGRRLL